MKKITKEELQDLRRDYSKWFENVEIDMRYDLMEALETDRDEIDDEDLDQTFEDFCNAIFPWNNFETQNDAEKDLEKYGFIEG